MKPRKTLREMESEGSGRGGLTCPHCGAKHMERTGGRRQSTGTMRRYRRCRNPSCGAVFVTSQPAEQIVREVEQDDEEVERVRIYA